MQLTSEHHLQLASAIFAYKSVGKPSYRVSDQNSLKQCVALKWVDSCSFSAGFIKQDSETAGFGHALSCHRHSESTTSTTSSLPLMAVTLDTTKRIQKAEDPGIKNSQNHKGYVNKEQPQLNTQQKKNLLGIKSPGPRTSLAAIRPRRQRLATVLA
jgi:hypothetical protein